MLNGAARSIRGLEGRPYARSRRERFVRRLLLLSLLLVLRLVAGGRSQSSSVRLVRLGRLWRCFLKAVERFEVDVPLP